MNKKLIAVIGIIAIVAIIFGAYLSYYKHQTQKSYVQQLKTVTLLAEPKLIKKFKLIDNKNKRYTNQNLIGHWTMFFFGFTNCPYLCPTTLAALKTMTLLLQQQDITAPQVIMISVDPKRDTVRQLNTYVTAFNPKFIGLTGSQKNIDLLAKSLNVLYIKIKKADNSYAIDHSGTILLINPQGKLAAIFSMPHDPDVMAHDFALIQKN